MENQEISQEAFSKRIGISKSKVSKIINGNISLDDETIDKIALVLGTSKELWRNLESEYKGKLLEIKAEEINEIEKPMVKESN
ncbi:MULTISPECIES: helix-turn-helix transcriptional regulator [Bacillota]|uniref:helix-turn-helix transcriptional regulator n=1 Tax=Bacillota TaxID=1239 RepID=UPI00242A841C|nr:MULTISPECIES: helix-turn-helix domain-containing protein [Bacillota]